MGHFGFSYMRLLFLLMLIIPNLIWENTSRRDMIPRGESKVLLGFERIGQVLATCSATLFSDFNLRPWLPWSLWLVDAFLLMLLYESWWLCYFRSEKTLADFYSSVLGIPAAGATLPVMAFLLLGIYGRVIWLIVSALILGIGHISIHLQHRREITD